MRQKTFDNTDESGIFQVEQYREFAEYVRYKEAGLRKEAFLHLNSFLDEATAWSVEERHAFIRAFFAEPNEEMLWKRSSFPLLTRLLIPVVRDWSKNLLTNRFHILRLPTFACIFQDIFLGHNGINLWMNVHTKKAMRMIYRIGQSIWLLGRQ